MHKITNMSEAETFAALILAFLMLMRSKSRSTTSTSAFTICQQTKNLFSILPASLGTRHAVFHHPIINSFLISFSLRNNQHPTPPHTAETTVFLVLNPRSQQLCKSKEPQIHNSMLRFFCFIFFLSFLTV